MILLLPVLQAQTTLTLVSANGYVNVPATLNLRIAAPSGAAPASVGFSLSYTQTQFSSLNVAAGPAAQAAGKQVSCADQPGKKICVIWGLNSFPIPNGELAYVSATAIEVGPLSVQVDETAAADSNGSAGAISGNTAVLNAIRVTDWLPPRVSFIEPINGSTVSGVVRLTVSASDNLGLLGVQFFVNGVPLGGELSSGPFTVTWDTTGSANGNYTLTARARDVGGLSATATTTVAVANSDSRPSDSGLVLALSLDEAGGADFGDESGSGNHAVATGGTRLPGRFGGALSFDGIDDWLTVADSASLRLAGTMTVEAWVNPSSSQSGWRLILSKEPDDYYLAAGHPGAALQPAGGFDTGTGSWVNASSILPLNTWTHLALTADGSFLRLYVNGVLSGTRARAGAMPSSNRPLRIGGDSVYREFFEGAIDEVRVYNRALSQQEIVTDMNTPIRTATSATPALGQFVCTPVSLRSGEQTTCTVSLTGSAGAGGATVGLVTNNAALAVPASVTVAAGAVSQSFQMIARAVTSSQAVTLTATLGSVSRTASLTVDPEIVLSSLACAPNVIATPGSTSCTATLSAATGAAVSLSLAGNHPALLPPSSATVPAGSSTVVFTVPVTAVGADVAAQVSATWKAVTRTAPLSLLAPPSLVSFSCNPSSLAPGQGATCGVTLNRAAGPSGFIVSFSSSVPSLLAPPGTITIPAGQAAASFPVVASSFAVTATVTLTATGATNTLQTVVSIDAPVSLSSFSCTPSFLATPAQATCSVLLSQPAPANGVTVSLFAGSPSVSVPATVFLPGGAQTASFPLTAAAVAADQSVSINATLGGTSRSFVVTLQAPPIPNAINCQPNSVSPGASTICTVALNRAATGSGLNVLISSSAPGLLPVPSSVFVLPGSNAASFAALAGAAASSTVVLVSASANGALVSASVTVESNSPRLSTFACAANAIPLPGSTSCTVTLTAPAPVGGATLSLLSNSPNVMVPAWSSVPAGSQTLQFNVLARNSVTTGSSVVTLTASYGGVSRSFQIVLTTLTPSAALACTGQPLAARRFPSAGGSGVATFDTVCPVSETAISPAADSPSWLSLIATSPVGFELAPNPGTARIATIQLAGVWTRVLQSGDVSHFADLPAGDHRDYADALATLAGPALLACGWSDAVGLRFCPEAPITRATLAIMLSAALLHSGFDEPAVNNTADYSDLPPTHLAAPAVRHLGGLGIRLSETSEFGPDAEVTEAELASLLHSADPAQLSGVVSRGAAAAAVLQAIVGAP